MDPSQTRKDTSQGVGECSSFIDGTDATGMALVPTPGRTAYLNSRMLQESPSTEVVPVLWGAMLRTIRRVLMSLERGFDAPSAAATLQVESTRTRGYFPAEGSREPSEKHGILLGLLGVRREKPARHPARRALARRGGGHIRCRTTNPTRVYM